MGKGTIISGGTDGQYSVTSVYNKDAYTDRIASLTAAISAIDTQILATDPGLELNILKAQKLSLEKNKSYLESNMPADETLSAWCADLTEDLTGDVGLIEIPGESVSFNIQPGYESNAVYNKTRDGQLVPTIVQTPEQAFYNLAMLPGWQKWKPTFRYATITSITGDSADITMESATSTQQGLDVNQETALDGVTIEYMNCNGSAFTVGDSVLVSFTGQDWVTPKIIGFKDNPEQCGGVLLIITSTTEFIAWDLETNAYADTVKNNSGNIISFPYSKIGASDFLNSLSVYGESLDINVEDSLRKVLSWVSASFNETTVAWGVCGEHTKRTETWTAQVNGMDETGNVGPHTCTKSMESNQYSDPCAIGGNYDLIISTGLEYQHSRKIGKQTINYDSTSYTVEYDGVSKGSPQSYNVSGVYNWEDSAGAVTSESSTTETWISKSPVNGQIISTILTGVIDLDGNYLYDRDYALFGVKGDEEFVFSVLYEKEKIKKVNRIAGVIGLPYEEITGHCFYTDSSIDVSPFANTINTVLTTATEALSEVNEVYLGI